MTARVVYPTTLSGTAYMGYYIGGSPLYISARSSIDTDSIVAMPYNGYIPPPPAPEVVEKRCDYCNSFVTEESKKNRECGKCGAPV